MARGRSLVTAALLFLLVACGTDVPPPVVGVALSDHGAMPVALDIPALGLNVTDLQMFGTGTADAGYACPPSPDAVSWDSSRPRPGQPGLARLVASKHGAFRRLADLGTGDLVVVRLSDGRRLTFSRSAPVVPDTDSPSASLELFACGASVVVKVYAGLVS